MSWLTPVTPTGFTIAAIGPLSAEIGAAAAAAGGRLLDPIGWDTIDDSAALAASALVIAVVPGDIGHGPLERLATMLDATGTPGIVAFEAEALDAVAALLMDPRVQLLCDPGPSDWATALAIARLTTDMAPASVREGGDDGERLRRLNEEVARIAALLAGLVESEAEAAASIGDRRQEYGIEPSDVPVDPALIRQSIRARRLRAQFVDPRLIEDPGWDMLLDLFASELEGGRVSVSSLCIAAAVAPTTALRWTTRMVAAGLFVRVADAGDRRRAFLTLTPAASAAMRGYVAAATRAGVPVV